MYGSNEKKIIKIFRLDELEKIGFWQRFLAGDPEVYSLVSDARNQSNLVVSYMPNIIQLLEQEGISLIYKNHSEPDFLRGKQILTAVLPEDDKKFSSPHRLVIAVS